MFVHNHETHRSAEALLAPAGRDEQRRRNAAARRKLEALRELALLRNHLTDVWDEAADR